MKSFLVLTSLLIVISSPVIATTYDDGIHEIPDVVGDVFDDLVARNLANREKIEAIAIEMSENPKATEQELAERVDRRLLSRSSREASFRNFQFSTFQLIRLAYQALKPDIAEAPEPPRRDEYEGAHTSGRGGDNNHRPEPSPRSGGGGGGNNPPRCNKEGSQ